MAKFVFLWNCVISRKRGREPCDQPGKKNQSVLFQQKHKNEKRERMPECPKTGSFASVSLAVGGLVHSRRALTTASLWSVGQVNRDQGVHLFRVRDSQVTKTLMTEMCSMCFPNYWIFSQTFPFKKINKEMTQTQTWYHFEANAVHVLNGDFLMEGIKLGL